MKTESISMVEPVNLNASKMKILLETKKKIDTAVEQIVFDGVVFLEPSQYDTIYVQMFMLCIESGNLSH